jgi:hypothetical protein
LGLPPGAGPVVVVVGVVVVVVLEVEVAGTPPGLTGLGAGGGVVDEPVGTTTVDGSLTGLMSPWVSVPVAVAVSVTKPRSTSCWVTI